ELGAISYSLTPNGFVVSARAAGGRLTLKDPFLADLDLAALATATRHPRLTWSAQLTEWLARRAVAAFTNLHSVGH
ncbi:MAG: hypothetical protein QOG46_1356, partial [Pseudonocardiales bacterium]|nr:hypothetical protein [Pseudonocardiales bacterium]